MPVARNVVEVSFTPGVRLGFWLEPETDGTVLNLWVKRLGTAKASKQYKVIGITSNGELFRYTGLPHGWGFQLVSGNKIREVP